MPLQAADWLPSSPSRLFCPSSWVLRRIHTLNSRMGSLDSAPRAKKNLSKPPRVGNSTGETELQFAFVSEPDARMANGQLAILYERGVPNCRVLHQLGREFDLISLPRAVLLESSSYMLLHFTTLSHSACDRTNQLVVISNFFSSLQASRVSGCTRCTNCTNYTHTLPRTSRAPKASCPAFPWRTWWRSAKRSLSLKCDF